MKKGRRQKIYIISIIILSLILLDFVIGYRQEEFLRKRVVLRKRLEKLAYYCLRSDIENVEYTQNGEYRITIRFENVFDYKDLYIMLPSINVFVQVGTLWKEVPVFNEPDSDKSGTVVRLITKETISEIADITVKDYTELMGYMHVKVADNVFVSFEAEPKEHIIEKRREYFIYIKPYQLRNIRKGPRYIRQT